MVVVRCFPARSCRWLWSLLALVRGGVARHSFVGGLLLSWPVCARPSLDTQVIVPKTG